MEKGLSTSKNPKDSYPLYSKRFLVILVNFHALITKTLFIQLKAVSPSSNKTVWERELQTFLCFAVISTELKREKKLGRNRNMSVTRSAALCPLFLNKLTPVTYSLQQHLKNKRNTWVSVKILCKISQNQ